jgi:hypothetical protein
MFQAGPLDARGMTVAIGDRQSRRAGESPLKQPSILDVVHGVKSVAPAHPEVAVWWYTPPQRLRLAGELPRPASAPAELTIEVVVAGSSGSTIACDQIAGELSRALAGIPVAVRPHRGAAEERPLFRIVSRAVGLVSSEAPEPA